MKKSKKWFTVSLAAVTVAALAAGAVFAEEPQAAALGTAENPYTDIAEYTAAANAGEWDGKDVYVEIDGEDFDATAAEPTYFVVANMQNSKNPAKLHLTIKDSTFKGNTQKDNSNSAFMYLSNCQSLTIDNCTFTADPAGQKYGINWNLVGIQDSAVSITNSTFTGPFEKNALKLNQRNGADDAATDVKGGNTDPATIKSAVVSGCTFEDAGVSLGSAGKGTDGAAAPSTGAFPVTFEGNKGLTVQMDYMLSNAPTEEEQKDATFDVGDATLVKGAGTDVADVHYPVVFHPATEPTATEDGNYDYWYCEDCGQYFSDAALTDPITVEDTIWPATGENTSEPDTQPDVQPDTTPEAGDNESPATGDTALPMFVGLAAVSGLALLALRRRK